MNERELIENWVKYQQAQLLLLRSIDDKLRSMLQILVRLDIEIDRRNVSTKKAPAAKPTVNAKRPPKNTRSKGAATTVPLEGQITIDQAIEDKKFEKSIGEVVTELV